jgi:mRNA-degrading endonuclease toxin of MazEF toxin-antitoxin module
MMSNQPGAPLPLPNPKRGEVWRVRLNPVQGSEQEGQARPVVVLSEPPTGRPTMRLCQSVGRRPVISSPARQT